MNVDALCLTPLGVRPMWGEGTGPGSHQRDARSRVPRTKAWETSPRLLGGRKAVRPRLVPLILCQAGGTSRDIIRLKWR